MTWPRENTETPPNLRASDGPRRPPPHVGSPNLRHLQPGGVRAAADAAAAAALRNLRPRLLLRRVVAGRRRQLQPGRPVARRVAAALLRPMRRRLGPRRVEGRRPRAPQAPSTRAAAAPAACRRGRWRTLASAPHAPAAHLRQRRAVVAPVLCRWVRWGGQGYQEGSDPTTQNPRCRSAAEARVASRRVLGGVKARSQGRRRPTMSVCGCGANGISTDALGGVKAGRRRAPDVGLRLWCLWHVAGGGSPLRGPGRTREGGAANATV